MSPAVSLRIWASRGAWALLAVAVILTAFLAYRTDAYLGTAVPPPDVIPAAAAAWQPGANLQAVDWSCIRGRVGVAPVDQNALNRRFRLAGTFSEFTMAGSTDRRAILDDAQTSEQLLVSERDILQGDILVVQIQRDRVLLRDAAGTEAELELSFTGAGGTEAGSTNQTQTAGGAGSATARFGGVRVGESQWLFHRDALLRYYQELRDQPERLVTLFDSLKPDYDARNRITGYRLGVEGERDFFDAVGLQEGDIVRKVNNVDMTNRRRAEFFIQQFVENEANGFMLDVERGGSTNRMTYEVR